ncbi:MAG: hypothetical protein FWE21_04680 [Defluviitaleaceae bacterium]|nr:hypothetical protein [Defluviitaleaceae bacterium]
MLVIAALTIAFLIGISLEFFRPIVSPEEFVARMKEAGYAVEERVPAPEQIKTHLVADCDVFYVEFMVHETMADARRTFARLRNDLEQLEQQRSIVVYTWSSSGFNSWYGQITSDGQVARMTRVRNTIIFVSTIEEHYDYVMEIWERLGQ